MSQYDVKKTFFINQSKKQMKTQNAIRFLFLGILCCIIGSCSGSSDPSNDTPKEDVTAVLSGRIVDANGAGIASATVACGSQTGTTDADGIFKLSGISGSNGIVVVSAKKSGFYDAFRRMSKSANGATNLTLALRAKQKVAQFSSSQGTTTSLGNGSSVSIPANGIKVESTGSAYNGMIDLYAYNLDPTQDSYADYFPGDFSALDASNQSASLFSHGINRVEMFSTKGEKLNLITGATARLTYPIPQALAGQPPSSIPIWHFDETTGLWKETGVAQLQGNSYIVDVSHFSTVNLDYKGKSCTVIVTVVDCQGKPIAGATVSIGFGQGTTDYTGIVKFLNVPAEMSAGKSSMLDVKASARMNGMLNSASTTITNLIQGETRNVTLFLQSSSLSGRLVDCSGNLTSGMVKASWSGYGFSSAYANGNFTIPVPSGTLVNLSAGGKQMSVTIPSGCNPYSIGDIKIDPTGKDCSQGGGGNPGDCSLIWSFDGQTYDANNYKYQGITMCGNYYNGTLNIRGMISGDPAQGMSLQATVAGTGTFTLGAPQTQIGSALMILTNGKHYSSYNVQDTTKAPTGTITIDTFNSSVIKGRFSCTMYNDGGLSSGSATLSGTFTVNR